MSDPKPPGEPGQDEPGQPDQVERPLPEGSPATSVPRRVSIPKSTLPRPIISFGDGWWRLEREYLVERRHPKEPFRLLIPEGFEFDLASVPRSIWPIIAPFELSISAPLVHDFIYKHCGQVEQFCDPPRNFTRREADLVFYRIMELEGVSDWRRAAGWTGVRAGGWVAWRRHGRCP